MTSAFSNSTMGETGASGEEHTDILLVALARTGDSGAFGELVRRHEGRIFGLARHITRSTNDAEDISQDTFLAAFRHLAGFQGNSTFRTWVTRIAVNESVMRLRRARVAKAVSLDEPVRLGEESIQRQIAVWKGNPEERCLTTEVRLILNQAIASLPPGYRTVLWLRDVDGLSIEDTAKALDLSRPAVKSRLMRARTMLRERISHRIRRKEAGSRDLS